VYVCAGVRAHARTRVFFPHASHFVAYIEELAVDEACELLY